MCKQVNAILFSCVIFCRCYPNTSRRTLCDWCYSVPSFLSPTDFEKSYFIVIRVRKFVLEMVQWPRYCEVRGNVHTGACCLAELCDSIGVTLIRVGVPCVIDVLLYMYLHLCHLLTLKVWLQFYQSIKVGWCTWCTLRFLLSCRIV